MTTDYSIWAFAYARSEMPHEFFGGTLRWSNKGVIHNPMIVSAIVGGGIGGAKKPIVFDTGVRGGVSPRGKVYKNFETPDQVLAKVGIRAEEVETLVLTHLHFDHAGNIASFPNAKIYIQRAEYDGWKKVFKMPGALGADVHGWPLSSINPADFEEIDRLIAAGRVVFLDGDAEIAPGVVCRLARDTHTFGSQWAEVRTPDGPYVIAGDCVYWYDNIEAMWPPAYVQGSPWNLIETYVGLRRLLEDRIERIVPGHDPVLFERHPSWTAGANEVAELRVGRGAESRRPSR